MNEQQLAQALADGYYTSQVNALRGVRKDKRRKVQQPKGLATKQYSAEQKEV